MKKFIKSILCVFLLVTPLYAFPQVSCFGWMLVNQKIISVGETLCVYEKNGVQINAIVNGFCPFNPPGCR